VLSTTLCTLLALFAFAANSLLCRVALRSRAIDPATFSAVRLAAGAVTLRILVLLADRRHLPPQRPSWASAGLLFLYAVPFSFAYLRLTAGTGALLLFGAVQVTMVLGAVARGVRPRQGQWVGLALALAGLVYLVLPGLTAPDPASALLMLLAGAAWGLYTLRGQGTTAPLRQTASNFAWSLPLALVLCLVAWPVPPVRASGFLWALLSGGLASGIGYALWYAALPRISVVTAAVTQLAVPIVAAAGGVVLLQEQLTFRLGLAAALVLSGIGLATLVRAKRTAPSGRVGL
jgi:drug/metabolite transporter (DMT)-like permease